MIKQKIKKNAISSNIAWKFAERILSQCVSLIVSIVLARILQVEDFGLLAITSGIIFFLNTIVNSGFGYALIQKKDADPLDFSSGLIANIVLSLVLYAFTWFCAPYLATFYGQQELCSIVRALGLVLIVNSFNAIQRAYVARNMLFRFLFVSTLSAKISSGVIGISLAFCGFGIWALIAQTASITVIECVVLWSKLGWRPKLNFSFTRAWPLFSFGSKLVCLHLVESLTEQVRILVIGKYYSSSDLGFYKQGELLPNNIASNIITSVNTVIFPVLSKLQNSPSESKALLRQEVIGLNFLIYPLMIGLAIISNTLIPLLLTDKWILAIPFVKIACFTYAARVIDVSIRNAITAIGKSSTSLILQISRAFSSLFFLFIMLDKGILMIGYGLILSALLNVIVSAYFAKKMLSYTIRELLHDIFYPLLYSCIMGVAVYCIGLNIDGWKSIFLQVTMGVLLYLFMLFVSKNEFLEAAINKLKK